MTRSWDVVKSGHKSYDSDMIITYDWVAPDSGKRSRS